MKRRLTAAPGYTSPTLPRRLARSERRHPGRWVSTFVFGSTGAVLGGTAGGFSLEMSAALPPGLGLVAGLLPAACGFGWLMHRGNQLSESRLASPEGREIHERFARSYAQALDLAGSCEGVSRGVLQLRLEALHEDLCRILDAADTLQHELGALSGSEMQHLNVLEHALRPTPEVTRSEGGVLLASIREHHSEAEEILAEVHELAGELRGLTQARTLGSARELRRAPSLRGEIAEIASVREAYEELQQAPPASTAPLAQQLSGST